MKTLKFSTNLKCGGCLAGLTPYMDADPGIAEWSVDLEDASKTLVVKGEEVDSQRVIELVRKAGFEAKELKGNFFRKVFG